MINKVEDRLIGMIDAKYRRLERKIQWMTFQGVSKERICKILGINRGTVERAIKKINDGVKDEQVV